MESELCEPGRHQKSYGVGKPSPAVSRHRKPHVYRRVNCERQDVGYDAKDPQTVDDDTYNHGYDGPKKYLAHIQDFMVTRMY